MQRGWGSEDEAARMGSEDEAARTGHAARKRSKDGAMSLTIRGSHKFDEFDSFQEFWKRSHVDPMPERLCGSASNIQFGGPSTNFQVSTGTVSYKLETAISVCVDCK